jgi:hypothetical protein
MFYCPIQTGDDEYVILGQIDGDGNEIWSQTHGEQGMDAGKMIRQTADGRFILVGDRADAFPSEGLYQSDLVLIKTDAEGNKVWTRTYGDEILYLGWGVAQTPDGGYVLIGWEAKTIPDRDAIAIKTDEEGNVEWSRTWDLDPGDRDGGFDMILTDERYVVIACIQSMGSGGPSAVLIKVDLEGNDIWNKLVGEEGIGNTFWHIVEDPDGGYVMARDTHLGKVSRTGEDMHGAWMIKTDTDGKILWQQAFGKGGYEQAGFRSAALILDGGYIFVGEVTRQGETCSDIVWIKFGD